MSDAALHPTIRRLIEERGLAPHPEGGYFREVHRSATPVQHPGIPAPEPTTRAASTMIEFLLVAGDASHWHRVRTDEIWVHLAGDPLAHEAIDPTLSEHRTRLLAPVPTAGPIDPEERPHFVIPPGHWQAARTRGEFTLAACFVAPGFDFADFTLLRDDPDATTRLRTAFPDLVGLL